MKPPGTPSDFGALLADNAALEGQVAALEADVARLSAKVGQPRWRWATLLIGAVMLGNAPSCVTLVRAWTRPPAPPPAVTTQDLRRIEAKLDDHATQSAARDAARGEQIGRLEERVEATRNTVNRLLPPGSAGIPRP